MSEIYYDDNDEPQSYEKKFLTPLPIEGIKLYITKYNIDDCLRTLAKLYAHSIDICDSCPCNHSPLCLEDGSKCKDTLIEYAKNNPTPEEK